MLELDQIKRTVRAAQEQAKNEAQDESVEVVEVPLNAESTEGEEKEPSK